MMRAAPKCDMLDQVATCARERKIESERGATENVFAPVRENVLQSNVMVRSQSLSWRPARRAQASVK